MFEATSDLSHVSAEEIVTRDSKEYHLASGQPIFVAQVETVGNGLLERKDEILACMRAVQERRGYAFGALMVTDILAKGTDLLVTGDRGPVERTFGRATDDGVIELPGVMSRKKQVVPRLIGAS
jgi:manganese-dependent inorganic pyrophosphatase